MTNGFLFSNRKKNNETARTIAGHSPEDGESRAREKDCEEWLSTSAKEYRDHQSMTADLKGAICVRHQCTTDVFRSLARTFALLDRSTAGCPLFFPPWPTLASTNVSSDLQKGSTGPTARLLVFFV